MDNWVCYLIMSLDTNSTYIGASNDQPKRLATHNSGKGAKYTKGQTWIPILVIEGFTSKRACLSFEAGWKRLSKKRNNGRLIPIWLQGSDVLKYGTDPKWNRIMDLLYFTHNFTFHDPKFICRPLSKLEYMFPPPLEINIFSELWINDLPWPCFVECYDFDA
jgi:putative endonuclease